MKAASELAQKKYDDLVFEHRTEMKAAGVHVCAAQNGEGVHIFVVRN